MDNANFYGEPKRFTIEDNILIGNKSQNEEKHGLSKLILDSLTDYPDFVGQIIANTGEKTTFREIKEQSVRCALWLRKQGVGKNDVVCLSAPPQNNDIVPCLATYFVGAIFNPWNNDLTPVQIRRFLDMMQPKVLFANVKSIDLMSQVAKEAGALVKFVAMSEHPKFSSLRDLLAEQTTQEVAGFKHAEPEDPKSQVGAVLFSSGTTGKKKGAMISYDTLVKHRWDCMPFSPDCASALCYSPLSWITGCNLSTYCLRKRITRIIHEDFDVEETSRVIAEHKVNFVFFTPSMLTKLLKANVYARHDYSALQSFTVGGSMLSEAVLEATRKAIPHCLVANSYGITELGGCVATQTWRSKKVGSIGDVVEGVRMKVTDPISGKTLGPNQEGELCFSLDNMMLGYWDDPEETRKMIDDEGWLHSGDLGYFDEDGEISVINRLKEVIITQNHHVSPSEIENILLKHPGVSDAAVVPVAHSVDVERPMAFVVKSHKVEVTAEELVELPVVENPHFRLTGGVVFVEQLPYNSSGKKVLQKLKDMAKVYAQ